MSVHFVFDRLVLVQTAQDTASLHRFKEGVPPAPPPLPGGVTTALRAILNAPLWMWVMAILAGVTTAVVMVRFLWPRRHAMWSWLVTRDRGIKLAIGGAAALILGIVTWGGVTSWNYMQHKNAFCIGCHIMEGPWNKFSLDAGKHSKLECHNCHQQSLYASTRQLVLWVANRPEKIPPHAPIPNGRCEACHAKNQSEMWTRIKQTAGHRTHLESDSTALKGVQCITCHGAGVHEFIPAKATCGKSGCHEKLEIRLGKMAEQTTLHCNQCHKFTLDVPLLATRDSAAGTLRPGNKQCLGCHEMQKLRADFDPAKDPHGGVCGTCHNPHTQASPQAAGKTCTDSKCHGDWRNIPFHVGTAHRRAGERCLTCHNPHASRLDPSDCVACHTRITSRFGTLRLRPPLPFDTARVLRGASESRLDQQGRPRV
jgi:nitrate/TMAO reductase-like tetraheme cytochrome c subunit